MQLAFAGWPHQAKANCVVVKLKYRIISIDQLKTEVEKIFGRKILTSRDCIQLSEDILAKTGVRLSENTLRRFYGLVKAAYPPSRNTLNLLSRYTGYESFNEIELDKEIGMVSSQKEMDASLLRYLISLFRNTPVKHVNDETFMWLVRHTINFLSRKPSLIDEFQRAVAKTKNGQEFYFEQFIHIDKLNSYYGNGLRYYMSEKKTLESVIWANSLLCFRYWLTDDKENLKKQYGNLQEYYPDYTVHPFVCGRYFAAGLYHAELFNTSAEPVILEARKFYEGIAPGTDNYRGFPCFEYLFGEGLVLTGHYDEAMYYLRTAFANYKNRYEYIDSGFYTTISLCRGIAMAKLGDPNGALKQYNDIRPFSFYFLSRQYNSILHIILCAYLRKCNAVHEIQLNQLIEATGFVKFRKLMSLKP